MKRRPAKKEILNAIDTKLRQQESLLKAEIESINKEIGNETKSSAGDKFETSREMMNQELNRLELALSKINQHQKTLAEIRNVQKTSQVEIGSLVDTAHQSFLMGIGLGEIKVDDFTIMAISLNSPIGKAFYHLKEKASVNFMHHNYIIQSIE